MTYNNIFHPNRLDKILAIKQAYAFIPELADDSSMTDFLTRDEAINALQNREYNLQEEYRNLLVNGACTWRATKMNQTRADIFSLT